MTMTLQSFIFNAIKNSLPASVCYLLGFWILLHCWFNMWAEIMCYEDKLFYDDWWNSTEFGTYYRKWNTLVHEWLYYYVYTDI
jgi:sterol O-acyltransferase